MSLKTIGTIAIPDAAGSEFDHAAFDPKSRRVFIAHTARDCVEVIDHDAGRHLATLPGFPGVAGAVADDGQILVTNRGSASIALLDAGTLETRATFKTGGRPNGAVIVARSGLGIAACIGVDGETPTLQLYGLSDRTTCVDRPAGTAALVRHRCRRRTDVPLHPRALDGAGGPPARPRRGDALEGPVSGRARSRHRSFQRHGFMLPAMIQPWSR